MTPDEIEAICRQVLDDRRLPAPPLEARLPLTFRPHPRLPAGVAELADDPTLLRQLVAVGQDGIGAALPPETLFTEAAAEEGLDCPEVWEVVDADGALAYRVWMYGVDNGTVFVRDTLRIIAGCAQGSVEGGDDAVVEALVEARARIPAEQIPAGSCIRFFGA